MIKEIETIKKLGFKINKLLFSCLGEINFLLVDYKMSLVLKKKIILADEISPDEFVGYETQKTKRSYDKDIFTENKKAIY